METHYVWTPPGAAGSILLAFDVIDGMLPEVLRAFGAVPKRGLEVGGLLLGTRDGNSVTIDGFQFIECEHRFGPGYEFTDEDRARFDAAVAAAGARAVGLFRSHTGDGFGPTGGDQALADRHFPDANAAVLLIKPYATKVSQAGFFPRIGARLAAETPLEFPFSRKLLGGGPSRRPSREGAESESDPVPAPPPPPRADSPAAAPPPVPSSSRRAAWWAAALLGMALSGAAGFQAARVFPLDADEAAYRFSLEAVPKDRNLEIRWKPNSPVLRPAIGAELRFRAATGSKTVPIDLDQLRYGLAIYGEIPQTPLRVELEVRHVSGVTVKETHDFSPTLSVP